MASKYSKELENKIVEYYSKNISPYQMVNMIPELQGKRPSVVYGVLKRLGVDVHRPIVLTETQKRNRRKYDMNDDYFHQIDTEEKAYWLGFIYADGFVTSNCSRIGIALSVTDKNHLEKFKQAVGFNGDVKEYDHTNSSYSPDAKYTRIILASSHMKRDLIKLGVYENKTEILNFPTANQVPQYLLRHFIRGYFDGDGSITKAHMQKCGVRNYSLKFTGTFEMIQGIQNFFGTHVKEEQRHPDRNVNNYSITFGGMKQVLDFLSIMYDNSTIYLERKFNLYKQLLSSMANATEDHG